MNFVSVFILRAFLGPTVGGVLVDKFQFGWAASFCSLLFGIAALLMSSYASSKKFCCPIPEIPLEVEERTIKTEKSSPNYDDKSGSVINL
ncbi:hypothetical protein KUTeg_000110 [Tegillarca granosa]|uniref:Uncharacterized protein n=1 Tax=Tegillarca granosa TaxID=220873 RepID=A0ABQ9FWL3_TEGGR|nr:hypothetical protein KUTeg_000110 [Tegillarca granosa]